MISISKITFNFIYICMVYNYIQRISGLSSLQIILVLNKWFGWQWLAVVSNLGWELLSQFPPFRYFPNFSSLSKHTLAVEYRVYIWQVSPQLSCGDTCQIWMWFEESNMYFCKVENFDYGEINERSFSNPHPWIQSVPARRNCNSRHIQPLISRTVFIIGNHICLQWWKIEIHM